VADVLKAEPGVEVSLVNGNPGEFTVSVDGRVVAQKDALGLPDPVKVREAVRAKASA
jgi:hypothetical protein